MTAVSPIVIKQTKLDNPARLTVFFTLPEQLAYFDGHFAERAVLPGFVQIHWITSWALEYLGCLCYPLHLKAVKFIQPLLPSLNYKAELELSDCRSTLTFVISAVASLKPRVSQSESPNSMLLSNGEDSNEGETKSETKTETKTVRELNVCCSGKIVCP